MLEEKAREDLTMVLAKKKIRLKGDCLTIGENIFIFKISNSHGSMRN